MGLLKKKTTKKTTKKEDEKIEDIVAATETDGGLVEETDIAEFELVEDGEYNGEDNE